MRYRPLVALDCDGIISDFLQGALDAIFEVTGKRFQKQDVTGWNPWLSLRLQPDECDAVFHIIETPGWCESLEVMPGAVDGFSRLFAVADITIVTAPWASSPTWVFERQRWLSRHIFPAGEVIHTDAKHRVSADYFADDHATQVRRWSAHNSGKALLWSQPHNRNINDVPRVSGWDELINIVTKEAAK
jgi:5'(3')-deoxyribonucleotidase